MLKNEQDRNQLQMWCLETSIGKESIVRVVDVFVDSLDLEGLGFEIKGGIKNGAPAYPAISLLKLYYYGYLNRVRSSRRLEREGLTNLEAIWLLKGVQPGYKTIANFRKDNPQALKKVFKVLNAFLRGADLFDEGTVAVDGSKFRAQNSKKNNYNEKKVKQHLEYIDRKTEQYLKDLDALDKEEAKEETEASLENRLDLSEQLNRLQKRKTKYKGLEEQVQQGRVKGQTQVSTTDPDARALAQKMNIVEVGYNVVSAAELKNKLITNFEVTNELDTYALADSALEAREVLGKGEKEVITVLADKGFDTGSELKRCIDNNISTIVASKKRQSSKKDKAFGKDKFVYDWENDEYICPEGQRLKTNKVWYHKKGSVYRKAIKFHRYKLPFKICNSCPVKLKCAGLSMLNRSNGRQIERSEYEDYIDENTERTNRNKELYRKRQETMEHQYGTIKRQWGYTYTLMKTKEKVSGEFAIIFTCYNLRRSMSILGVSELIKRLKDAFSKINPKIDCFLKDCKLFFQKMKFSYFFDLKIKVALQGSYKLIRR